MNIDVLKNLAHPLSPLYNANNWFVLLFICLLKSISPNPNIVPRNKIGKKSFNNRFQQFLSIANCIQLWIGKHTYFILNKIA
ncbi:hypothetical protein CHT99_02725 [Sphingobacterium cellulitidis]|nr:hypothetical protein CHT99_02725 [Sphingobacterium cellulitidis]